MTTTDDVASLQAAIDQAVATATGPLTARIAELETAAGASATDAAIAAAVAEALAPVQARVDELQSELDTAVADKVAAQATLEATVNFLQAEDDRTTSEARAEERVTAVADLKLFDQAHIDRNKDRWAGLADADWDNQLAEYAALAASRGTAAPVTPPLPGSGPGGDVAPVTATAVETDASPLRRVLDLHNAVDAAGAPIRIAGTVG